MNIDTSLGLPLSSGLLENYFRTLVNQVYKILPMRESKTDSLQKYVWRLSAELIGGTGLYPELQEDSYFASLLNILQYLSDHSMDCSIDKTKQLVFEGIHICEKLSERYASLDNKSQKAGG